MEKEEQHTLEHMEHELVQIRKNTSLSWKTLLISGILRGAGFILGTVIAVALAGWLLSALGIIPGINVIAQQLHTILQTQSKLHS